MHNRTSVRTPLRERILVALIALVAIAAAIALPSAKNPLGVVIGVLIITYMAMTVVKILGWRADRRQRPRVLAGWAPLPKPDPSDQ